MTNNKNNTLPDRNNISSRAARLSLQAAEATPNCQPLDAAARRDRMIAIVDEALRITSMPIEELLNLNNANQDETFSRQ